MKTFPLRLLSLLATLLPLMAVAQSNIKSAFDAIIKCPQAEIRDVHSISKDPLTNSKTGQYDIYTFTLPADKMKLINNLVSAFEKDSDKAYEIEKGVASKKKISVAVGDGTQTAQITEPGAVYTYSLFLAPKTEDPRGIYRYAYGMNYKEEDGKIQGQLIVTYATTLQYRQQMNEMEENPYNFDWTTGMRLYFSKDQQSWFDSVMTCLQSMTKANSQTRIALATKMFNLIQDSSHYPEVTSTEKNTVREIIKNMLDNDNYSETVLNTMLRQCLANLK